MHLDTKNRQPERNSDRRPPRVAVLSMRNMEDHVSRACGYEFEDMICEHLDFARLVLPARGRQSRLAQRLRNRATRGLGPIRPIDLLNLGAERQPLGEDFELFFFSAAQFRDLVDLQLVPDWRDRSRFAVCWMQELWGGDITEDNRTLDILNQFDHVVCSFHHSIEPLRRRVSVPVSFMPWGVDTELFCPFPVPPARAIKVAGIGTVREPTERALVRHTEETGTFFYHETVFGRSVIEDHRKHRKNYASILKRSEYFLCYMAKYANSERGTQQEFGLRYVEGIAAGAILLGDRLSSPAFDDWFGWPDSVIQISGDEQQLVALIQEIDSSPERIAAARSANIINALERFDNLYRWQDILRLANMDETPAMEYRHRRLLELVDMVRDSFG